MADSGANSACSMAVFVGSCDRTRDVFLLVSKTFLKWWRNCPYPRYVGQNTLASGTEYGGFEPVLSPVQTWSRELFDQISRLREEYVLLVLDDFAITRAVDGERIQYLLGLMKARELSYLRLIEIQRSWLVRMASGLWSMLTGREVIRLPDGIPYYSSLQMAIWRREHLLSMLAAGTGKSIWEFEHLRAPGVVHYAVTGRAPIRYRHLVEKGRWLPDAGAILGRQGLSFDAGTRPVWPPRYRLRMAIDKLIFSMIGYAWMRSKRIFL